MPSRMSAVAMTVLVALFTLISLPIKAAEPEPTPDKSTALPLWQAVALGAIEGATEYLPVSSTGHLLIFQHWMGLSDDLEETEAAQALAICIQIGAILAVVLLYFKRLRQMVVGLLGGDPAGLRLFFHLIIAFIPAAIIGILFKDVIKEHLFNIYSVATALAVGAMLILVTPGKNTKDDAAGGKDLTDMKWHEALLVGVMQCLAFWPGFSRSLSTILGCRVVGLRLSAAVEFSFLLGLVTLSAATAKEGLDHGKKIFEYYGVVSPLIALGVAFVFAVISVRFMVGLLSQFGLAPFAYYRLLLAALCIGLEFSKPGKPSAEAATTMNSQQTIRATLNHESERKIPWTSSRHKTS